MHLVTVGDVVLDVLVNAPHGLRTDDDTEARIQIAAGGQAANVAAWAVNLGANATLIGPLAGTAAGEIVRADLARAGVVFTGVPTQAGGTVVSIVEPGTRTMASDAGDQSWLTRVDASLLPGSVTWLHLSSYPLLRSADPRPVIEVVRQARRTGARVSLDFSSASLIEAYGALAFRDLVDRLDPALVFANQAEWNAAGFTSGEVRFDVVLKQGAEGIRVIRAGRTRQLQALAGVVVDTTGAGDALAAGYLVGGERLALATAARCIGQSGAQPPTQPAAL